MKETHLAELGVEGRIIFKWLADNERDRMGWNHVTRYIEVVSLNNPTDKQYTLIC
jgi:hypothetical protein